MILVIMFMFNYHVLVIIMLANTNSSSRPKMYHQKFKRLFLLSSPDYKISYQEKAFITAD